MTIGNPMADALRQRAQDYASNPQPSMQTHMQRLESIYGPGTQTPGGYTVYRPAPTAPMMTAPMWGGMPYQKGSSLPISNLGQIAAQNYTQTGDPFRSLASMQPTAPQAQPTAQAAPMGPSAGTYNQLSNNLSKWWESPPQAQPFKLPMSMVNPWLMGLRG